MDGNLNAVARCLWRKMLLYVQSEISLFRESLSINQCRQRNYHSHGNRDVSFRPDSEKLATWQKILKITVELRPENSRRIVPNS